MGRRRSNLKPRKQMSSYTFFMHICREDDKKQHPNEKFVFTRFSRKCAERWKTMSEKEKKRFQEMADRDKNRYELEMQNYVLPKGEKGHGKKRRQAKNPESTDRSIPIMFSDEETPRVDDDEGQEEDCHKFAQFGVLCVVSMFFICAVVISFL